MARSSAANKRSSRVMQKNSSRSNRALLHEENLSNISVLGKANEGITIRN